MKKYAKCYLLYKACPNKTQEMAKWTLLSLAELPIESDLGTARTKTPFVSMSLYFLLIINACIAARSIFESILITSDYQIEIGVVDAYFELLLKQEAGFNVMLYWLDHLERHQIRPSLKMLACIAARFAYAGEKDAAAAVVDRTKDIDPANYRNVTCEAILRALLDRKEFDEAGSFLSQWLANLDGEEIPAEVFKYAILEFVERPRLAMKFHDRYLRLKYPRDIELDAKMLQVTEKTLTRTETVENAGRFEKSWSQELKDFEEFLNNGRGMYFDDLLPMTLA